MTRAGTTAALLLLASAPAALGQRVAEVQMAPPTLRMVPDAQSQLSATAYDTAGTPLNVKFRWTSSNVNVVVVDSTGTARAIAPGTALIFAYPLVDPSRRAPRRGQIPVRVLHPAAPGMAPTATGGEPAPPTGAAGPVIPPTAVMPRPPFTGQPPMVMNERQVDSIIKASINCEEPMINATNPMRACYDQRPVPRTPLSALSTVMCEDQHGGVMLMVRVDTAGAVTEVRPYVTSRCPTVTDSIVAMARAMTFRPARRASQPVPAWVRIVVRTGGLMPPERPEPAPKP